MLDGACQMSAGQEEVDVFAQDKTRSYCLAREQFELTGSQAIQRCPSRQTEEDQAARRIAMSEAASEAAKAEADLEQEWKVFEERIRCELQAQRADANERRERRENELEKQARLRPEIGDRVRIAERDSEYLDMIGNVLDSVQTSRRFLVRLRDENYVWFNEQDLVVVEASEETLRSREIQDEDPDAVEVGSLPVWIESVSQEAAEEREEAIEKAAAQQLEMELEKKERAAQFLKDQGFRDILSPCRKGSSQYPLHVAVEKNDAETVRCLLIARADPIQRSGRFCSLSRRQTPKEMAIRRNRQGSHDEVLSALNAIAS
jgi:hypothetical protein